MFKYIILNMIDSISNATQHVATLLYKTLVGMTFIQSKKQQQWQYDNIQYFITIYYFVTLLN